jgi:hypothetical protein
MASWGTSVNASEGTTPTLSGTSTGSALTPTSEASAIAAVSNVDYFNRAAWRIERDLARASLSSAETGGQTDQGSKPRSSGEVVVGLKRWEGRILEISDGLLTIELMPSDHDGPELVGSPEKSLRGIWQGF